jgi:hypothetical protein
LTIIFFKLSLSSLYSDRDKFQNLTKIFKVILDFATLEMISNQCSFGGTESWNVANIASIVQIGLEIAFLDIK